MTARRVRRPSGRTLAALAVALGAVLCSVGGILLVASISSGPHQAASTQLGQVPPVPVQIGPASPRTDASSTARAALSSASGGDLAGAAVAAGAAIGGLGVLLFAGARSLRKLRQVSA